MALFVGLVWVIYVHRVEYIQKLLLNKLNMLHSITNNSGKQVRLLAIRMRTQVWISENTFVKKDMQQFFK